MKYNTQLLKLYKKYDSELIDTIDLKIKVIAYIYFSNNKRRQEMCLRRGVNHELIQHDRIIHALQLHAPTERKKKERERSGRSVKNTYNSQMTV